jgi:hypothetical protein
MMRKIQLVEILDRGIPNKERVHLAVLVDADLSFFVLLKTFRVAPLFTELASGVAPAFWFPTTRVLAGDQVVLYSGKGTNSRNAQSTGTTHVFYWGLDKTVWNLTADVAVLVEALNWDSTAMSQTTMAEMAKLPKQ